MFGDPQYAIKRRGPTAFQVAKFTDAKGPDAVYDVGFRDGHWHCNCFAGRGDRDKHANLVCQFLAEGEPMMKFYVEG